MADLSQHKTLIALRSRTRLPRWAGIVVRVVLLTMVGTLLTFAVTLLFAILATVIVSAWRGVHPDMRIAYRDIALPVGMVAALVLLLTRTVLEVREYCRGKALDAIERMG